MTDPELLEKTGGIIQGMSGSPIIQNGKLYRSGNTCVRAGFDNGIRNIYRKYVKSGRIV